MVNATDRLLFTPIGKNLVSNKFNQLVPYNENLSSLYKPKTYAELYPDPSSVPAPGFSLPTVVKVGLESIAMVSAGAIAGYVGYWVSRLAVRVGLEKSQSPLQPLPYIFAGMIFMGITQTAQLIHRLALFILGEQKSQKVINFVEQVPKKIDVIYSRIFNVATEEKLRKLDNHGYLAAEDLYFAEAVRRAFTAQVIESIAFSCPEALSVYAVKRLGYAILGLPPLVHLLIFLNGFATKMQAEYGGLDDQLRISRRNIRECAYGVHLAHLREAGVSEAESKLLEAQLGYVENYLTLIDRELEAEKEKDSEVMWALQDKLNFLDKQILLLQDNESAENDVLKLLQNKLSTEKNIFMLLERNQRLVDEKIKGSAEKDLPELTKIKQNIENVNLRVLENRLKFIDRRITFLQNKVNAENEILKLNEEKQDIEKQILSLLQEKLKINAGKIESLQGKERTEENLIKLFKNKKRITQAIESLSDKQKAELPKQEHID